MFIIEIVVCSGDVLGYNILIIFGAPVSETLTELPGEAGVALQRWVVERVPAVHHPGVGQRLDAPQGQQVGVLQPQPPRSVLDAPLQGAETAVLRVAENFDALTLHQAVWREKKPPNTCEPNVNLGSITSKYLHLHVQ